MVCSGVPGAKKPVPWFFGTEKSKHHAKMSRPDILFISQYKFRGVNYHALLKKRANETRNTSAKN